MRKRTRYGDDAIRVRRDKHGRVRYEPTSQAPTMERRFILFAAYVLEQLSTTPTTVPVSATLVAFDAVADLKGLKGALDGLAHICQWRDMALVDWFPGGGWRERRALSAPTQLRLAQALPSSVADELSALSLFAQQAVPRWAGLDQTAVLKQLFVSARTWSALNLPGILAAHVRGECPLQLLARETLAREHTGQALIPDDAPRQPDPNQMALLDGVMSGRYSSDLGVIQAIDSAAAAIRDKQSAARARDQLKVELTLLIPRARQAGALQSLVLAWALHLVHNGTQKKHKLAPRTLGNYLTQPMRALAEALLETGDLPSSAAEYSALYERMLDRLSSGQHINGRSVAALFHYYLMAFHDAPHLETHLEVEEGPPSANVIWPHEIERIRDWLEAPDIDRRLARTLQLIFALAYTVRLRTSEVLSLRLRNVIDVTEEIEFAPLLRDSPGKSAAARRTATINAALRKKIDDWVGFRRAEGAGPEDLLFGDPHDPRQGLYRPGAVLLAMRQMLKAATGDAGVNFHSMSHGYASRVFAQPPSHYRRAGLNTLDQISADMGHFSAATLRHYVHLIEGPLRQAIDDAIDQCVPITSATAARICSMKPQSLRKRAERARATDTAIGYYALTLQSAKLPQWSSLSDLHETTTPEPPVWLVRPLAQDPTQVLATLTDVAEGLPVSMAAQRANASVARIHQLLRRALTTLQVIQAWQPRRRTTAIPDEQLDITFQAWAKSPDGLDFKRGGQARFEPVLRQLPDPHGPVMQSWMECYDRRYMALHAEFAQPLFKWLKTCGVSPLTLALSVRSDQPRQGQRMAAFFRLVFAVEPAVFKHAPTARRRPDCYLLWSSVRIGTSRPPTASCSLDGLHVWLLAVACTGSDETMPESTEDKE